MASRTQERVLESFNEAAKKAAARADAEHTSLASAMSKAFTAGLGAAGIGSVVQQTMAPTSSQNSGSSVVSAVSKVFTSGLGLVPLFSGLFGLFGGGSAEPPPLVKYSMPERVYFQGAETGTGIGFADYDQMGRPRAYGARPAAAPSRPAPQITVNVQAMDSRSFLDHSDEIAQAVRQAMLNLNSINDVVSDL